MNVQDDKSIIIKRKKRKPERTILLMKALEDNVVAIHPGAKNNNNAVSDEITIQKQLRLLAPDGHFSFSVNYAFASAPSDHIGAKTIPVAINSGTYNDIVELIQDVDVSPQ